MKQLPLHMRPPELRLSFDDEINADLFAGGGGASTGIEAAGHQVHVALNHDPIALAVHRRNHPKTQHLEADVWSVKPLAVTGGRRIGILWLSPDCRDFSVAKGGKPRNKRVRSLANVVFRWVKAYEPGRRPRVICLENVREFEGWGPLDRRGRRIKSRIGEHFRKWKRNLERLGYVIEHRILDASHYGARTRRKRFFLIARSDGMPIVWPQPTHGPAATRCAEPLRTAAECIDWSLPCPSIFGRKKPLAEKTLWRIAQGIKRFVLENQAPFIVKVNHGKREARIEQIDLPMSTVTATQRGHALVTPHLTKFQQNSTGQELGEPMHTVLAGAQRFGLVSPVLQQSGYGERAGQRARVLDLQEPLGTIVGCGQKHALVSAFLNRHFGDPNRSDGGGGKVIGDTLDRPLPTITARDHHTLAAVTLAKFRGTSNKHPGCADVTDPMPTISAGGKRGGVHVAEVRAFLTAYYSSDGTNGQELDSPLRTLPTKARFGLVTIAGVDYEIADIGFRMLEPHELLRAQFGRFADTYDMSAAKTKADKIRLIGNSVCPEVAEAIILANMPPRAARAA